MEPGKLDQLKIEREPELEPRPVRWPLVVVAIAVLAAIAWWVVSRHPRRTAAHSTGFARALSLSRPDARLGTFMKIR